MKLIFKTIALLFLSVALIGLGFSYFSSSKNPHDKKPYETESAIIGSIKQEVVASGVLKLKDIVTIGSSVSGWVSSIAVEEGDTVEKGQLLAVIDTGLKDTEVREAEGALEKAIAELEFSEKNYQRQLKLHAEKFTADATLEESRRNYLIASADVKTLRAVLDRKMLNYKNCHITAPIDGEVIRVEGVVGGSVSSDSKENVLLTLAPKERLIETEIHISERDIGLIRKGQTVRLTLDTFPGRIFESTIHSVSFTPKDEDDKESFFVAKATLENPEHLLRPGMSVSSRIEIAAATHVLKISSRPLLIKKEHLTALAEKLDLTLVPIDDEEKVKQSKENAKAHFQYVWAFQGNEIKEIPIEIGVSDAYAYEIKSGLKVDDEVIADVVEEDQMLKLYDRIYKKF